MDEHLTEFRKYYNHSIHPELLRSENKRRQLLGWLAVVVLFLSGLLYVQRSLDLWFLTAFLTLPVILYLFWWGTQLRKFVKGFKPGIISLLLDFIDNSLSYGDLKYEVGQRIDRSLFDDSRLFLQQKAVYSGEDFISGTFGDVRFQLSELNVKGFSPVKNEMAQVFQGLFLVAWSSLSLQGRVWMIPRSQTALLGHTMKGIALAKGKPVDSKGLLAAFEAEYSVWATAAVDTAEVINEQLQRELLAYRAIWQKPVLFSMHDQKIFVAVPVAENLLEPNIFTTNVSFATISTYYQDLKGILKMAELVDAHF
jgi:hypothetical protein